MQEAAVLVPLYRNGDGELRIVLIRRGDVGVHAGEIAFPGGKRASSDQTLLDTALRETEEEIGLVATSIEIIEHLPVVQTETTGFRISPFLARVVPPPEWHLAQREVAELLDVPINDLVNSETHAAQAESRTSPSQTRRTPFYRVGQYRLWGASYRILHPLLPRCAAEDWTV